MSPNSKWLRWKWCWPDCISSVDSAPSATLPSVGLSPSCTSFLSLTHFFYPWITSSLNSTLPRHFPDLVLFSSWRFCGNNESEGTCFLQCSQCRVLTLVPAGNTCGSPPVLPEGEGAERGGARRLLLNSPTLCHPPPLPAPWWVVASRAHCPTQETNVGSLRGLSNLHLPPLPKKTSFPFTNLWTVMPC